MRQFLIAAFLTVLTFPAFSNARNDPSLAALLDYKETRSVKVNEQEVERAKILRAKAHTLGIQSGAYYASKKIKSNLEAIGSKLDSIYDFSRLGIAHPYKGAFIVNPVIAEIDKSIMLSPDSRSFIVRDQTFAITKEPYLSLTPPSWRSYLFFAVEPPQIGNDVIKPRTPEEIKLWREEMLAGYEVGIRQVEQVTATRFARLTRDIIGMMRFELLKQRNIVSDIKIADVYFPVSGGGNRMNVNESRVSIEVNPQLNSNRWNWATIPRLADVTDLFPNGAMVNDWVTVNGK